MTNNLFNRNQRRVSLLFLGIALLLFQHSCKKDSSIQSDVELIQQAKFWFDRQPPVTYSPDWDSATVTRLNDRNFVILPSNLSISESDIVSQSYLVVDVSLEETKGNLIELFNSSNLDVGNTKEQIISNYLFYFDKVSLPRDLDFKIMVFDIDHKFIKGSNIIKGRFKNELNLVKLKDLKSQMLMRGGDEVGFGKQQCTDWYLVTRINGMEVGSNYLYTTCSGGGGAGGCGGGGGSASTRDKNDIKNKTTDPCINSTVQSALDANKDVIGMIGGIISLFDASKKVRLNIYDGTTDHGTVGQYKGGGFVGNIFQANITLQTSNFKNSSKESLISTLIHESVHAYIHTSGSKILEGDHETISKKYIDPMATYLHNYFGMDIKDAYSLAWSGLADSRAYIDAKNPDSFIMSDGNVITKDEIASIAGAYAINGEYYADQKKRGTPICN